MRLNSSRIGAFIVGLTGILTIGILLWGQEPAPSLARISLPHDWSHRHIVFSNPSTVEQGMRVRQDPRFWQQYFRRKVPQTLPTADTTIKDRLSADKALIGGEDSSSMDWFRWLRRRHRKPSPRDTLKRDWSVSLGPNATVGAANFPAKFSFDINRANCGGATQPDFVVFNTSVNGSSTQASIVAYDNLYTGCGGTVPKTYWAYNTGGAVLNSVVLSLDGSQIAFIQTPPLLPIANLVLLKWKASVDGATSTMPDPISMVLPSQYPTCTAPCMTTLAFSGIANDTNSSPFYDYTNDALYVGDDNGSLHKFHPVFSSGVPAEAGGGWPVSLAIGLKLSSPVYDFATRRVFVGSGFNGLSGGQLFAVDATTGNIFQTSAQLAKGNGIASGPIVDSTAGLVYVFVGTDTGGVTCVNGGTTCSGVYQFSTNSISGGGRETPVSQGSAAAGFPIYLGSFDNSYYTSANATGSLYVCGQSGGKALLVKISIVSGFMSTAPTNEGIFAISGSGNVPCSAVTEVFNPNLNSGVDSGGPNGTDKIFLSTQGGPNLSCDRGVGGCLWALPATSWQPGTAYSVGQVILDDGRGMCIQVVTTAGMSGALIEPNWAVNAGVSTADSTVTWTGKMCLQSLIPPQSWFPNASFGVGFSVFDPNGNIEAATVDAAMGGSAQPNWPLNIGSKTVDGAQVWVNVGPVDVASLPVLGGTSGIVVDNTVPTATLAGGSQIYFSPLGMGFGTCGAGNGCAVQASQAALK
jgi:hypothetical protein